MKHVELNHWAKRGLQGALVVGGLWLLGAGIASAETTQDTATLAADVLPISTPATLTGTPLTGPVSADIPIAAPVTACGNSVAIFANPAASCPSSSSTGSSSSSTTADGRTANAPVTAPISATGNSVQIGHAFTGSASGTAPSSAAPDSTTPATTSGDSTAGGTGLLGTGPLSNTGLANTGLANTGLLDTGLLGGTGRLGDTSTDTPVTAPATVCGNTVGLASDPSGSCPSSSTTGGTDPTQQSQTSTVGAPVNAPVQVCGNSIGLFGGGGASCAATAAGGGTVVVTPSNPSDPGHPMVTQSGGGSSPNPLPAALTAVTGTLASTGGDVRAVLALALGLLYLGTMLALATGKRAAAIAA